MDQQKTIQSWSKDQTVAVDILDIHPGDLLNADSVLVVVE